MVNLHIRKGKRGLIEIIKYIANRFAEMQSGWFFHFQRGGKRSGE